MGAPLKRDAEGNEGGSHVTIWGRCLPDGQKSQYTCPQAKATLCLAVPGGPCDGVERVGESTGGDEIYEEPRADYVGPPGQ